MKNSATLLAAIALAATVLGLGLADSGWGPWWSEFFQHPRWQYLAGALAGILGMALARRWRWALAGVALALWALWPLAWLAAAGAGSGGGGGGGAPLAVLSANVHSGNDDPAACVATLLAEDAEVLAVIEVTPDWLPALAPLRARYPVHAELPRDDNFGIALYARSGVITTWWPRGAEVPSLELRRDDGLRLLATHPLPPLREHELGRHHRQLAAVAAWARAAGPRCAVVGDLNCTPWSRQFRALCRDGDLHPCGLGAAIPTWMRAAWLVALPLDHVLAGPGLALDAHRVGPDVGSDHHPVQARLRAR